MANIISQPCDRGVILASEPAPYCGKARARWILAATILGSSMAFIDGTVVNVALPALQKELHATVVDVQWVVEGYALFLAALLLVGGALGDRYGRRLAFVIGVSLFASASVSCAVSPSIKQLIVARAVQGIGGALLVPGSLAIIGASFDEQQRGKAIGTWSGFSAITTAIGPVIGGWLIEHVSWRAVFFINVPLAIAVVLISLLRVPESRDEKATGQLDWRGALLATVGLGGIVYGLIESSRLGFGDAMVITALAIGVLCLTVFMINEAKTQNPMLPLGLFRSQNFSGANLLTLLLYGALSGALFFLPLNLIQVQDFSATAAGAAFLPFVLIMFLLSRWSGGLVDRFGARIPLVIGPVIAALGFGLFILPGIAAGYWKSFFPAVVVLGLGMATSVAPLTTTVMAAVSKDRAGIASGVNNTVARTAGLLAIAVMAIVMVQTFDRNLERRLLSLDLTSETRRSILDQHSRLAAIDIPSAIDAETRASLKQSIAESFVSSYRLVMILSAALALLSALTALLMINRKDIPAA